jgi:hypothetical protein
VRHLDFTLDDHRETRTKATGSLASAPIDTLYQSISAVIRQEGIDTLYRTSTSFIRRHGGLPLPSRSKDRLSNLASVGGSWKLLLYIGPSQFRGSGWRREQYLLSHALSCLSWFDRLAGPELTRFIFDAGYGMVGHRMYLKKLLRAHLT